MPFTKRYWRRLSAAMLALALVLGLVGCGSGNKAPETSPPATSTPSSDQQSEQPAQPTFDWKRHAGTTINVWVPLNKGYNDWLEAKVPEFEALTGIKVNYEYEGTNSYRTKQPVELTARSSQYDVMGTMVAVEGRKYLQAGWYEPLDAYINDPTKTNPDFDFNDFPGGIRHAMQIDGQTVTILWEAQTLLLYYRKDLFEQKGLKVPTTFEELEAAAKALHDPANKFYGIALRGGGYLMTTPLVAFLYGQGGSWLDDNRKPAINTPEALKAFELYGRLSKLYGAPDMVSWGWEQPAQNFAQGNVGMFLDINLFPATLEDPSKSNVVGKVGYAVVPAGPAGAHPFTGGWGYMINPFSEKKDAAWYFIQWATGKDILLEVGKTGWPAPRNSYWNSEWKKSNDNLPQLTEATLKSYDIAQAPMNPPVVAGLEARKIVGAVGDISMQTADPAQIKQAADEANRQLEELMQSTE